jgi:amino acid transporter
VTVRGAAFLGIGAMVGAGIFALLGEAGAVAGAAVWLSFLLAGIVATLLGYTITRSSSSMSSLLTASPRFDATCCAVGRSS